MTANLQKRIRRKEEKQNKNNKRTVFDESPLMPVKL